MLVEIRHQMAPLKIGLTKAFLLSSPEIQEKQALQALLQADLSPPNSLYTRFIISSEKAKDAIKLLSLARKLYFSENKLFFDPFTALTFSYEASTVASDLIQLQGKWKSGSSSGNLDACSWLFLSDPPLVIKHGALFSFSGEIDLKWYALVYPKPCRISSAQLLKLQAEWEEDGEMAPTVVWLSSSSTPPLASIEPMPFLQLTDRTGAFANLFMDYAELGRCNMNDLTPISWRRKDVEKGWENDLLETGFIKKRVDESDYYCPLSEVAKSLTFLLEIGWKIFDHEGRLVVRQKAKTFQVDLEHNAVVVKGRIHYENHEADLTDLLGAFNRRDQFLVLDNNAVGLIDRVQIEEEFGDLAQEQVVSKKIMLKKNRIGLLASILDQAEISPQSELLSILDQLKTEPSIHSIPPSPQFQGKLFPYQQKGLDWLCYLKRLGFSGLLADDMGLGKTVQVLAFFSHLAGNAPSLIVAPTSLLFNWRKEIQSFLPEASLYVHNGSDRKLELPAKGIILTSYSLLRQDKELFQSLHFETIVLDEGQNIKNPDSQIAQTLFKLHSEMRLILSGTPIENRWEDLWSLFHFLMPDLLGEKKEFSSKMAAAASDSRYLKQTRKKTRPFLLRRKKEDVAIQLPEKISQVVWVDMSEPQRCLYESWVKKNQMGLLKKIDLEGASSHRMEILEAILRLRQICCHPWLVDAAQDEDPIALSGKMQRLMADLEEVVSEGKKVLIYSQFTQMLQLIRKQIGSGFSKHVYLDGSTQDRESIVQQFQEDPETQIFLISLKAGGVGLNLTAADYVFLYDPWWNEAAESQAIDRAHRLGRKGAVIARRYVTALSIEEKLMSLKKHKSALAEGILEGQADLPAFTIDELKALLQ